MIDQAPRAEKSVIGGIIAFPTEPEATKAAYNLLTPDMFSDQWLSAVFAACVEIAREGKTPDIVLVEGKLGKEHRAGLVACAECVPTLAGFREYCAIVLDEWRKREIQRELQEVVYEGPPVRQALERLENLLARQKAIEQGLNDSTSVDFWGGVLRYTEELFRPNTALKTGWGILDRCTGGLRRTGFYVISARSGKGKTDFALAMATNISLRYRASYFTMEMPVEQLMERMISRIARVDSNRLRDKQVSPEDMERISAAVMARKEKIKIVIDEKQRMSVSDLEAKVIRQRPDVVFVDHVGLMKHAEKKQLWEGVADTSQKLKELAMKYNIVVVALVQENRSGEQGKPKMGNLKGSDNLTNDADGIFQMQVADHADFISGDAWIDAEVHITKHRHGGTGKLRFRWQPQYHDWQEVDTGR